MPKRDKELPPEAVRALAEAEKRRLEKKEIAPFCADNSVAACVT